MNDFVLSRKDLHVFLEKRHGNRLSPWSTTFDKNPSSDAGIKPTELSMPNADASARSGYFAAWRGNCLCSLNKNDRTERHET